MRTRVALLAFSVFTSATVLVVAGQSSAQDTSPGDQLVAEYFRQQTQVMSDRTFAKIKTLQDWESRKGEYRRQLFEMLGLDPLPERTSLKSTITGVVDEEDFVVEKLHFQSSPGLYVTANLYRPKEQSGPLPAILYVCGHGRVKKDGVSYGNKTHYQHHGAWFARNGYVCLTIDTIQLGEIEGIHHGTYREKMWWWNNRGYSSAGAEAWNCIRALDYLQTRDEVDADRIGVTGRSGGGAYSWWISALDERIKVAVPVAGITSLKNHVVDGCVEGHCDCMFMVNTYRWDYPMVAALVAPRPLLISNTDKDRIFPLDGVVDVHAKVRKIYDLYEKPRNLGLHITEGPHKDTQELRVHAFRWFNHFLKRDDSLIETAANKFFEPEQLKVFEGTLPDDEIVTTVHEHLTAKADPSLPKTAEELIAKENEWRTKLSDLSFRAWPKEEAEDLKVQKLASTKQGDVEAAVYEFHSQSPYNLPIFAVGPDAATKVKVVVLDQDAWDSVAPGLAAVLGDNVPGVKPDLQRWESLVKTLANQRTFFVVPRGVGPTQWDSNERKATQIRRRFMLLGTTRDTMQAWDVRQAIRAVNQIQESANEVSVSAVGKSAALALYASLDSNVKRLELTDPPGDHRSGATVLNVSRILTMPQLVMMLAAKDSVDVEILCRKDTTTISVWQDVDRALKKIGKKGLTVSR